MSIEAISLRYQLLKKSSTSIASFATRLFLSFTTNDVCPPESVKTRILIELTAS